MSGKQRISLMVLLICLAALAAYFTWPADKGAEEPERPDAGTSRELMLYCGAGIRPAAEALTGAFKQKHGIGLNATYAGGGRQVSQIMSVQKGDLFMPGAEFYVDIVVDKGLANPESKRVVAYFVPVIFVQKGNPKDIRSLQDFKREGLRLGFGDERACAVGKKALLILEKNGIPLSEIEPNIVYKSGTVNELGVAIQLRSVDAVIVWDANARQFAEYGDMVPIPIVKNAPSTIPIVVLKSSRHPDEAQLFIDFATSGEGRRILQEQGYTVSLDTE